ncbi:class I SAM-dependent methyltransferase [Burkholderia pyrrocinia]|uniref:class I SAM-dependent methyltransferase n=1 Tax=Burkholderia pyrrocinia TaxID=60550 RepID=UPI00158E7BDA|nr:class I SAM-dependent methyltransferase [Burkholderia pyrrocinia]
MSAGSTEAFYRAFENRFRGPRELIKSRLGVYLPILGPLRQFDPHPAALDLGCGRGEWLEVLTDAGFAPHGVDLDEAMLDIARAEHLHVSHGDALGFLHEIRDETQFVVSGFHIAEHLAFHDLQDLVKQSLRVLRPGGFLILETPNPENIQVGTANFYLDPTHQRPLPPDLLSFLPGYYGFARTSVLRLQEAAGVAERQSVTLLDVLTQVSPDYAVIAQKAGDDAIMLATQPALEVERGVSLQSLANQFDAHHASVVAGLTGAVAALRNDIAGGLTDLSGQCQRQQEETARLSEQVAKLTAQVLEYETRQQAAQAQMERLLQEQGARQRAAHEHIEKLLQEIERYRNSRSWRVTAPLRAARSLLRKRS